MRLLWGVGKKAIGLLSTWLYSWPKPCWPPSVDLVSWRHLRLCCLVSHWRPMFKCTPLITPAATYTKFLSPATPTKVPGFSLSKTCHILIESSWDFSRSRASFWTLLIAVIAPLESNTICDNNLTLVHDALLCLCYIAAALLKNSNEWNNIICLKNGL